MNQNKNQSFFVAPIRFVFFMWLVYTLEMYLHLDFGVLGIKPRTLEGLIGILAAPLIHGNLNHLISNTLPVLALNFALYFFYPRIADQVFLQCYFFTNFFVWLLGRPFYHIGASGLVYGLAFFLIALGLFRRDIKSIIISVSVIGIYGGLIYGLTWINDQISWESHLMGAVVGIGSAYGVNKVFSRLD
jgi:membrane associated rhomboid family serine protease